MVLAWKFHQPSAGNVLGEKTAAGDLQLSVYALAAQEILDVTPKRLIFYNLMTNEPVATTRDVKTLAATKQKIAEVADQIRAGEFSGKPGFSCGYCDFKPLCPSHEQLILIRPAAKVAGEKLHAREDSRV